MRFLHRTILLTLLVSLSGCATNYSSLKSGNGDAYELIIADEQTILDVAYEAIESRFPDTAILNLAGKQKGYTFYTQPFLDRTTFKFTISKATGITTEGKPVVGYSYSIHSYGTQFAVERRYVEPFKSEFERRLGKRGVTFARVSSISFE